MPAGQVVAGRGGVSIRSTSAGGSASPDWVLFRTSEEASGYTAQPVATRKRGMSSSEINKGNLTASNTGPSWHSSAAK